MNLQGYLGLSLNSKSYFFNSPPLSLFEYYHLLMVPSYGFELSRSLGLVRVFVRFIKLRFSEEFKLIW